jgi:hypothetical protein
VPSAVAALYKAELEDRLEHTAAEKSAYTSADMLEGTWQGGHAPCLSAVHPASGSATDNTVLLHRDSASTAMATLASVFASIPVLAQYQPTPYPLRSPSLCVFRVLTYRASLHSCFVPFVATTSIDSSLSCFGLYLLYVHTANAIAAA